MRDLVERLSASFVSVADESFHSDRQLPTNLQEGYRYFLSLCDGGYTRDHFLHFFGQKGPLHHNLLEWNRPELWKGYYGLADESFVFAEDVFGTQFSFDVRGNRRAVKMLNPDGGTSSLCANTFEEFLETEVFCDAATSASRQLCSRFFSVRGERWRPFTHLAYRVPPSLGGNDADLGNLEIMSSVVNLKILGQIAQQVKSLPAGTRIQDVRIDYQNESIQLITQT
jgi:hypothetical protein